MSKTKKTPAKTSAKSSKTSGASAYVVKSPFKCKDTGVMYSVGKDVTHFNEGRLKDLINRGLVELKNV